MLSQHLDRSKRMPQIPILLFADVSLCCFSNIFWWKEKVFWSVPSCLRRLQLLAVDTKTEHAGNTTLCYARPSRERCKDRVSYKTLLSSFGCQLFCDWEAFRCVEDTHVRDFDTRALASRLQHFQDAKKSEQWLINRFQPPYRHRQITKISQQGSEQGETIQAKRTRLAPFIYQ